MEKDILEYSMMAHPVKVELVQDGRGEVYLEGNLYTIDPVTRSIVLLRFREDKPWKMDWVPREAIRGISVLKHPTDSCRPHSVELEEYFKGLFGMAPVETMNKEEIDKRRNRLVTWLRENHVEVSEQKDGELLLFGTVKVYPPYSAENCFYDNAIILKRIRALIEKVPKE